MGKLVGVRERERGGGYIQKGKPQPFWIVASVQ